MVRLSRPFLGGGSSSAILRRQSDSESCGPEANVRLLKKCRKTVFVRCSRWSPAIVAPDRWPPPCGLVAIPEMIQGGVFSKSAIDRLLQFMNGAMNRLVHAALLMRHDDRLAAIKARLDHAAFVVMAGLITNRVAEVYIDPPDAIAVPV